MYSLQTRCSRGCSSTSLHIAQAPGADPSECNSTGVIGQHNDSTNGDCPVTVHMFCTEKNCSV